MSLSQTAPNARTLSTKVPIDARLLNLLQHLQNLPASLSDHPTIYPFPNLTFEPHQIDHYGSVQGALNHRLELEFGSRSSGRPIRFRGRGSSLEAVVHTFYKFIDGENGENVLLWKWVHDLTQAAIRTKIDIPPTQPTAPKSRTPRRGKKATHMPRTRPSGSKIAEAKKSSAVRWPYNPADLEDDPGFTSVGQGRARDELLDRLLIPCHSITNPNHYRVRCRGIDCWWSWAEPRASVRVLRHASQCVGLEDSLRAEFRHHGASLSLASRLQDENTRDGDPINTNSTAPSETQQKRTERVNHALLKWLCDRMIAPSAVNCYRWREFVHALDPSINTASGSTITDNFVATEAAFIRQASVKYLSQEDHLTLSFDGGTTRRRESVYTVHVTTGSTRDAYLMEGNEASGVAHTAEHIANVIDKTLTQIGADRFISVVSDNAGKTRAARALIEQEYPWTITLRDSCHWLNSVAKDIGQLAYFQPCIAKLQVIITYFHTSSFAARHLSALRVVYRIAGGLISIGYTRFATYFYAAVATLRCLPLIRELLSSGVLDIKPSSSIYWMLNCSEIQLFEEQLSQLVAMVKPFARSIKCLESSHSTISDTYLFWLAILAHLRSLFKSNKLLSGAGLPEPVIQQISSILNSRHTDMFGGKAGRVYLAAFFLNTRYRGSDIFTRHSVPSLNDTTANKSITQTKELPDHDLRQSVPAYFIAGSFLAQLLGRIYNKNPDAPLFTPYASWDQIHTEFHNQFVQFVRGHRPFHQTSQIQSEHAYWESMRVVPGVELIAHLGAILAGIVPNSMSEERTMSTMTKLGSPDRASQHVSTLIDMATIRQPYRREEIAESSLRSFRPTIRFADLPSSVEVPVQTNKTEPEMPHPNHQALRDATECLGELVRQQDSPVSQRAASGQSDSQGAQIQHLGIESHDGVSLSLNLLTDLLSDRPALLSKRSRSPELPLADAVPLVKRQKIDVSAIEY